MRGTLLDGRYRLRQPIGSGGMGQVWRALDESLGREVAVKVFAPPDDIDAADRAELLARFQREARAAARLSSRHIVTVFDHGSVGDIPYLVMELVTGQTLERALRDAGRIPLAKALDWAAQICEGLAAAHGAGVIHRDIKPANLMLRDDGDVQILDFGIATFLAGAEAASRLTGTGRMPIGSVLYMAPEQFRQERGDGRIDLYALGCVLYELLVGRPPFTGPAAGVMYNHLHDAPLRPSRARADVPAGVERLVLDLMAKDPVDRPRDAGEVGGRIARLQAEVAADPEAPAAPAAPAERGSPAPDPGQPASPPAPKPLPKPQPKPKPDPPAARPPQPRPTPAPAPTPTPTGKTIRPSLVSPDRKRRPVSSPRALAGLAGVGVMVIIGALGLSSNFADGERKPSGTSGSSGTSGARPDEFVVAVAATDDGGAASNDAAVVTADRVIRSGGRYPLPVKVVGVELDPNSSHDALGALTDKYPGLIAVIGETDELPLGRHPSLPAISACEWSSEEDVSLRYRQFGLAPSPEQRGKEVGRHLHDALKKRKLLVLQDPELSRPPDVGENRDLRDTARAMSEAVNGSGKDLPADLISTYERPKVPGLLKKHRPDSVFLNVPPSGSADYARELADMGFKGTVVTRPDTAWGTCTRPPGMGSSPDPPSGTLRYRYVSEEVRRPDCADPRAAWCDRIMDLSLSHLPGALERYQAAKAVAEALESVTSKGATPSASSYDEPMAEPREQLWEALREVRVEGLDGPFDLLGRPGDARGPIWIERYEGAGRWKGLGTTTALT
ncbi:serine/threonine-protein kinase [Streptomyces sp. NPDC021622]|uniref:serine/threonine-protein kinase n=1 Tax=Streptomyces sp. NPDC021622 TaxID=3155013 RepID=UPI0033D24C9D